MVTQVLSPFLTLAFLKKSLQITNSTNDDKLNEIVDRGNEECDNAISPYISTPVATGDPIWPACRQAALRFAKSIWSEDVLFDLEKTKLQEKMYDYKIEAVIKELKSLRTEKTKTTLISTDPRNAKVILPTQASIFATDDF